MNFSGWIDIHFSHKSDLRLFYLWNYRRKVQAFDVWILCKRGNTLDQLSNNQRCIEAWGRFFMFFFFFFFGCFLGHPRAKIKYNTGRELRGFLTVIQVSRNVTSRVQPSQMTYAIHQSEKVTAYTLFPRDWFMHLLRTPPFSSPRSLKAWSPTGASKKRTPHTLITAGTALVSWWIIQDTRSVEELFQASRPNQLAVHKTGLHFLSNRLLYFSFWILKMDLAFWMVISDSDLTALSKTNKVSSISFDCWGLLGREYIHL